MQTTDFLVIGSGIAGLMYALDVAHHGKVTVLCKADPLEGNTRYAQGGIASVISPLDSFDSHIEDTEIAGAGLCDREVVEAVVRAGPAAIGRLVELGAKFDLQEASSDFALGREGGHSQRRILHARDATGAEIQRTVYEQAFAHPNIEILQDVMAIDLIVDRGRIEPVSLSGETGNCDRPPAQVLGAYGFNKHTGEVKAYAARATMLASGGVGKVYLYTSNPDVATGDGVAMAYRAGARIANMEFIQFHPTCLYHPSAKSFLITEAMRGEGAKLLNTAGEEFMKNYDERRELAPRDIVARAIDHEMKRTGADCVYLDISHRDPDWVRDRFPTIYGRTKDFGFDITRGPLPVVPAAHYCCGGVLTDIRGRTGVPRLYAAGEVGCTGLHGANRLASNSLLEALVLARNAAADTITGLAELTPPNEVRPWDYLDTVRSSEEVLVSYIWDEVRRMMWNLVGIVRTDKRLALAKRRILAIRQDVRDYYWKFTVTSDLLELRNIVDVADLIIDSAAARRESRGLHYNIDCPNRDDEHCRKNTVIQKRGAA